jgi:hypothetical protein
MSERATDEAERCPQCLCVGHHVAPCNVNRAPVGDPALTICPCGRCHPEMTDEQLTDEERARIENHPWPTTAVAKLLRIHDRLRARVEEQSATLASLEDEMGKDAQERIDEQRRHEAETRDMAGRIRELEARVEELERPPLGSHAADLQALRATQARVEELEQQYARFAADAYEQEGCGPAIADDKVRLMAWVMGGGDPDDPNRPGPPV